MRPDFILGDNMKHSEIVNDIKLRLEDICDIACSEQEYETNDCQHGEYDIAGMRLGFMRPDAIYLVEVKCRDTYHNRRKAMSQLGKDFIHFREHTQYTNTIRMFYAYSDTTKRRGYNIEEIK